MNWNDAFRRIIAEIDTRLDSMVGPMRRVTRPVIVPYRGYGTGRSVWIRGRVIDDPAIDQSGQPRPILGHTRDMWRRFASHEIAEARVEISFGRSTQQAVTDAEGYFDLELETHLESGELWHPYSARLIEPAPSGEPEIFESTVIVPPATARLGIISDIDDTVIDSSATDRVQMLRTLLFTAAESRLPFTGIADLFREILQSNDGEHPVFYVSSSPWNLYDFLVALFEMHDLPSGPLILQDFGVDRNKLIHASHDDHKLAQISRIIGTYPDLEWVLVGDSGQRDPEIYKAVADEVRDRVRAIVIRDVTTAKRDAEARLILEPLEDSGLPVALVRNAAEARAVLERAGLLNPEGAGL